jgi:heptosyltransferase-3
MDGRILVIRGGAIGDFILTLPAIRLVRDAFPRAALEILGYKHIVSLAEGRFYAQATRSIEYAPMARFFVPGAELDAELSAYFSGFQQIISYLSDPQGYFAANLSRTGAKQVLHAYSTLDASAHAAVQLARPLEKLALYLEHPAAEVFPNAHDHAAAAGLLSRMGGPFIALHPGSGSERKNWMPERWAEVVEGLLEKYPHLRLLLIGGEADERPLAAVLARVGARAEVVRHLALPHLAAVLHRCQLFLGHDTGIAHLAGASGAPCLLLFGPTDPAVWAPRNALVQVLEAPCGDFARLSVERVLAHAIHILSWRTAGEEGDSFPGRPGRG